MRRVIVYPDPDSEWWIATVPSLNGCVSQGETREAALSNIRDAIDLWIETATEMGREIPPESPEAELVDVAV